MTKGNFLFYALNHCCLSINQHMKPYFSDEYSENPCLNVLPPHLQCVLDPTECVKLVLSWSCTLKLSLFPFNWWKLFSRPSAYLYSCLTWFKCNINAFKDESMPKITFCFTQDYLEKIRKVMFALQVLPVFWATGLHFTPDVLFSNVHEETSKLKKKSPWTMIRDVTTKKLHL